MIHGVESNTEVNVEHIDVALVGSVLSWRMVLRPPLKPTRELLNARMLSAWVAHSSLMRLVQAL